MIQRLNSKNLYDIYCFVKDVQDNHEDFYITKNRERIFLKDLNSILKLLKTQEIYGIFDGELKAIMMIYKEKGFRPYLKLLSKKTKYSYHLLKYFSWNYSDEIFIKVKKSNPLANIALRFGFRFIGNRGSEILFIREKKEKKDGFHNFKD